MVRAFLIGAGATKAQYEKAPLSADFFKILLKTDRVLYLDIKEALHPHLKRTYQPYSTKGLSNMDVEDVMNMSYEFPLSIRGSFLDSLYLAIYKLLGKPTQSSNEDLKKIMDGTISKPNTLFKRLIRDRRLNEEDFFITLNYDLYLDGAILSTQHKIDYGISRELVHYLELPLDFSKNPSFSVYHLHGSLNWEFGGKGVVIRSGAINPTFSRSGSNLCLIPPGKKEIPPILKSIWETAEKRLLLADELIIIGCSLNPADADLIGLVKKFIEVRGTENVKIIYLSKNPFQHKKYYDVIGRGFGQYPYGFYINGPNEKPGAIEFIFEKKE